MEKIKIVTKQRVERLKNPFDEIQYNRLYENTFVFERGKIYGIVSEYGEGGGRNDFSDNVGCHSYS